MNQLVRLAATFFGTGLFPFAPATFASLVFGAALFVLPELSPLAWATTTLVVILGGIWVSTKAEDAYGHDGSPIVIDEVAGMLVTLFLVPKVWWIWGVGFLLFRVFDIVKPFPAGKAQELPRGWGVVLDDVAAGVYAHVALRLILWLT